MTEAVTQATIDALALEAVSLCPAAKAAELNADITARAKQPLEAQARFLRRLIDSFEAADVAKYTSEPEAATHAKSKTNSDDGTRKRPAATNPFSKIGWNVSNQGKLVVTLGVDKAAEIAAAAGCKIGDTHPNPDFA